MCPQDQVEVEVVQLTAIRIRAPITRMKTKAQVCLCIKVEHFDSVLGAHPNAFLPNSTFLSGFLPEVACTFDSSLEGSLYDQGN